MRILSERAPPSPPTLDSENRGSLGVKRVQDGGHGHERNYPPKTPALRATPVETLAFQRGRVLKHCTRTVPLAGKEYKWVPANCLSNLAKILEGLPCDGLVSGSSNAITRFMLRKLEVKRRSDKLASLASEQR